MYMKMIAWIKFIAKMELKHVSPASTNIPAISCEMIFINEKNFEVFLYSVDEQIESDAHVIYV